MSRPRLDHTPLLGGFIWVFTPCARHCHHVCLVPVMIYNKGGLSSKGHVVEHHDIKIRIRVHFGYIANHSVLSQNPVVAIARKLNTHLYLPYPQTANVSVHFTAAKQHEAQRRSFWRIFPAHTYVSILSLSANLQGNQVTS